MPVRMWDVDEGRLLRTFAHEEFRGGLDGPVFAGNAVRNPACSRNRVSGRFLTFNRNNTLDDEVVWDLKSGEVLFTFRFTTDPGGDESNGQTFELAIQRGVEQTIQAATFEQDVPHVISWHIPRSTSRRAGERNAERVWRLGEEEPMLSRPILRAIFPRANRNSTRAIRHHDGGVIELDTVDQQEPLIRLRPLQPVARLSYRGGSAFSPDETRILTWGHERPTGLAVAYLWDATLRDERPIERQQREFEARSGTRLDEFGRAGVLPFQEWQQLQDESLPKGSD